VTAKELLDSGQLSAALALVTEGVKANPGDATQRTALFELLCFAGDLDRAGRQLDVLGTESTEADLAVHTYRQALAGERERRRFYAEGIPPQILPPVIYGGAQLKAVELYRAGDHAGALSMLEEAEDVRPLVTGKLNGVEFDDFKDADDLLGPFLEAFVDGRYTWIAWESVKSLEVPQPKRLRDLVWTPAAIQFHSGPLGEVLLPALYVDSHRQPDELVRLGRLTEWREDIPEFAVGLGQKVVYAGQQEYGILELRSLEFNPCPAPA
jgi:type VI secretion system protein ImpE